MIEKWLTVKEIAVLLSRSRGLVIQRAQKEVWQYRSYAVRGGQERRYHIKNLPEDIQIAYAMSLKMSLTELQDQLKPVLRPDKKVNIPGYCGRGAKTKSVKNKDKLPEKYLEAANLKRKIIEARANSDLSVAEFATAFNNGEIAPELRIKYKKKISPSNFYLWQALYEKYGLEGLAPQYTGKGVGASLPQETKDRIEWLYLDSSQPSVEVVWELLEQYGIKAGKSTVRRYINSMPEFIKAKYRKGSDYYKARFSPYIIRNYEKYKPMEIICGDYMTEDLMCRKGNKVFRARLCAFEDMRSRLITGFSLQETANSIGVMRSLEMTFKNYGLPETVYVDNGKEFKNYLLCGDNWKAQKTKIDPELLDLNIGILSECGVKIIFCQGYHGQSKPIERFWRTMHERFDKFETSYSGSNTALRPDEAKVFRSNLEDMKNVDISLIPAFEEIEKRIGHFVNWYNEQWNHSGQGMNGRTPVQVFDEYAVPRREIPDNLKKYLFTMRETRIVQRSGVKFDGELYQNNDGLFVNHIGKEVEVRRGLDDAGIVHIFSIPDRVYLFDAEKLAFSGVVQEDIAKVGKLKKDIKKLEKQYNRKKTEYDKGVFKTPAESYAEEAEEELRLVSGGEPIVKETKPALTLVKPSRKPLKSIFDVD